MRRLILLLFTCALLTLQGCASCPRQDPPEPTQALAFNAATPIYRLAPAGHEALSLAEYQSQLASWLPGRAPAVLFVHGRGKEPTKSVYGQTGIASGRALQHLTDRGLRPWMFNWDSAADGLDRSCPLAKTDDAVDPFWQLLQFHAALRAQQPALPRPVLLVHSMGAIVLQKVIQQHGWPATAPGDRLFERIVFSEPDADERDHVRWLTRLAQREEVWVTWNRGDVTLNFATDAREAGEGALGLGVPYNRPLAPGVRYLDLSHTGCWRGWLNHTVFVAGSFGYAPTTDAFLGRLLAGHPIDPDHDRAIERRDERGVIRLKP
ncbi:alpha/beta hydrolase [Roseateles sp. BYS87W]|uniref:Alpha/beta hydrolase n=1 Tax=Pelomonas baiyunensis TaxID=3299026 RepID=A0ABW7H2N8_9BURK